MPVVGPKNRTSLPAPCVCAWVPSTPRATMFHWYPARFPVVAMSIFSLPIWTRYVQLASAARGLFT